MKSSKSKILQYFVGIATIFAIGGLHPLQIIPIILKDAFVSTTISHIFFLILLFVLIANPVLKKPDNLFSRTIIITIIYLLICSLFQSSYIYLSYAMGFFKGYIITIILLTYFDARQLAKFFLITINILLSLSVIGAILVFLGLLKPLFSYISLDFREILFYGFFTTKVNFPLSSGFNFVRPSGFFDEPGTFAFISLLCLLLNKTVFNNKKQEVFLLIASLITFSLAHIITSIIYLIIFYPPLKFKRIIILSFFFISVFAGLTYFERSNEITKIIYNRTIYRLETLISGDVGFENRQDSFEDGLKYMNKYPFGKKPDFFKENHITFDQNSIMGLTVYLGILGIIVYFSFIWGGLMQKTKPRYFVQFGILIMLNLLQRPYIHQPIYIILIYLIIYYEEKTNYSKIIDNNSIV